MAIRYLEYNEGVSFQSDVIEKGYLHVEKPPLLNRRAKPSAAKADLRLCSCGTAEAVLYKGMSREISPPRLGADRFFSRHSARLIVHAPAICEWSSSGVLFVSSQEAARYFSSLVVPFHGCDNAIRFLKRPSLTVYPLDQWQRMVLFETRGLWLSWIVRGGIRCPGRLACFNARIGLTASVDTSPRIRASQEPDGHHQEWFPGRGRTLCQRRSSCLLFHMFGVETYLLLPDGQGDRSNLPRQGETRHRRLPPFGEQGFVEIVERSGAAAGF